MQKKKERACPLDQVIFVASKFCLGFLPLLDSFPIFILLHILFNLSHSSVELSATIQSFEFHVLSSPNGACV